MHIPLHFREAASHDRDAMAEIYRLCVSGADWMPASTKAAADFEHDTSGERVFVVESGDVVVGFVSVWEPDAFIHLLFVHPQYQGLGIGSHALGGLIPYFPFPWRLKCTCANHRALEFYLKRGWQRVEEGQSGEESYYLLELPMTE